MRQLLLDNKTGDLSIAELPDPTVHAGRVLIRTAWSAVSVGTERAAVENASSSLLQRARNRPDQVRQVFESLRERGIRETFARVSRTLNKVVPLGYCYSGVVEAVAPDVRDVSVGDRVAGVGWGQGSHAELLAAPRTLVVKVPDGVDLRDAAFAGMGGIALEGVRKLDPRLGERVLVSGLGLLGLLAVQLLRAAGCRVFGIDPQESKVRRARELGVEQTMLTSDPALPARVAEFTEQQGFDGVLLTAATTSSEPLVRAAELSRTRGRIVIVGVVDISISRDLFYAKELDLRISKAFGPGSYDSHYSLEGNDYPLELVRWAANRNLGEVVQLMASERVKIGPLITHELELEAATGIYGRMQNSTEEHVGVAIRFGRLDATPLPVARRKTAARTTGIGLGFIGAGTFARGILLPAIKAHRDVRLVGVVNTSPVTAHAMATEFDFEYSGTDVERLLADDKIRCVFIGTRHDNHAELVCKALEQGKDVFVEKPLALSAGELDRIERVYRDRPGILGVDFNRRFSPLVERAKSFFAGRTTPLVIQYRVNAGAVPADHWVQDPNAGGGRILGEVCHFVDTIQYLAGAEVTRVTASGIGKSTGAALAWDNVIANLELGDGSIAAITYASVGHEAQELPKERIEIFGMGSSAMVNGFRELLMLRARQTVREKLKHPNYGHGLAVDRFLAAVRTGGTAPIPFETLINVSRATVHIQDALNLGRPLAIGSAAARDQEHVAVLE